MKALQHQANSDIEKHFSENPKLDILVNECVQ